MPRIVRPWLGWSLMLSLSAVGFCGCSEEPAAEPAANNQAQANAPGAAMAMPPGGMPAGMPGAPGAMPGAPGAMPGAPAGAMPGAPGGVPTAPGVLVPPAGAVAGAPPAAPDAAAAFANAPGGVVTAPGAPVAPADPALAFAGAPGGAVVPPAAPVAPGAAAAFAGAPGGAVAPAAAPAAPGAAAAFAGAPGGAVAAPGAPVAPGAVGGPGGGQNPQSQPGTFGFPAEKVALNLMRGDITGLEDFISPKCKGPLGDIRDGKATEKQIEDLKKTFTGLRDGTKPRNEGGAWSLSVRNADNAIINFKVKKEGEDFKVIEMTVKAGTAKKKG